MKFLFAEKHFLWLLGGRSYSEGQFPSMLHDSNCFAALPIPAVDIGSRGIYSV